MIVTESKFDLSSLIGPADHAQFELPPRSSGLHLSQIYRDIEDSMGKAKHTDFGDDGEALNYYRSVGFIWEWMMARAMSQALVIPNGFRPGEVSMDGITGSPDLLDFDTDPVTVVDTKAKYMSSNKLGTTKEGLVGGIKAHFWADWMQIQGYCYMLKTVNARLLILFVNGTWKPPRPVIRQLNLRFTPAELENNWRMLVQHAQRRGWLAR